MSAFDLRDRMNNEVNKKIVEKKKLVTIDEPITTFKIYDSLRQQDCCTSRDLGPVRAAETVIVGDMEFNIGDVVVPPTTASSVSMEDLKVKDTIIVSKAPSPFRKGYWDIDLKYIYEFDLVFREADGTIIGVVKSNNIFNKKLCLFGSTGTDLVLKTDFFPGSGSITQADPFVSIESKAVALSAEIKYYNNHHHHNHQGTPELIVTIGLFSIVKLFRLVDLMVESKGFYIPEQRKDMCPIDPCDFFDGLDFPMDIFSPPQKPEFMAGISGNIPSENINKPKPSHPECNCKRHYNDCNCY